MKVKTPRSVAPPAGITMAVVHVKMAGIGNKRTPSGEPITLSSVPFDLSKETPLQVAQNVIATRHKVTYNVNQFELLGEYDVDPKAQRGVPYNKLFIYVNANEHKSKPVRDHFEGSWYLKRVASE